jgi:hypothetical protein
MTNKHPYEKTHPRKREWVVETIAWGPEGVLRAIVNCALGRKPVKLRPMVQTSIWSPITDPDSKFAPL